MRRYRGRHARRSALTAQLSHLPAVAAPALLLPLANQPGAPADAGPAPAGALQVTVAVAPAMDNVRLAHQALAAAQARHAHVLARRAHFRATHVTVHPGDSLSRIARRRIGDEHRWMDLYGFNRHRIGPDPNVITPGQVLRLPPDSYDYTYVPPPPPAPPAPAAPAPQAAPAPAAPAPAQQPLATSHSGGSSFQQCVIARESGGNPRAVNPTSGAGGLYQFLPSTWAALGHDGLPQNASVAEQNQAFQEQYAQSGTAAWSPYDGC